MNKPGLRGYLVRPSTLDAVWLVSALLAPVTLALLRPISPFDYFWPLVQGRSILETGRIAAENGFLYTLPTGMPFVNQPWLAEVLLYSTYRVAGHVGNLVVLALVLGCAVATVMDAALRAGSPPKGVAAATLLGLPFFMYGVGVRTQMFAFPCFALVLRHLVLDPARTSFRSYWPICAAVVLWSNCHGSFVLAPLMLGVRALWHLFAPPSAESSRSEPCVELVLAALGTLLNPLGPGVYAYAFRLGSGMDRSTVMEWAPLSLTSWLGAGFMLLVALGCIGFVRTPLRSQRALLTLFLGLAGLSLFSLRFIEWWGLSAIVALPVFWRSTAEKLHARGSPRLNLSFVSSLVLFTLASLPGAPLFHASRRVLEGMQTTSAFGVETPLATVQALAEKGYPGKIFHAQGVGGLLAWALCERGPRPVAFVDQRFELTPTALWADYFAISAAEQNWKSRLDDYGVKTLLLHEEENQKLLRAVARDRDFSLVSGEYGYRLYIRRASPAPG